MRTISKKKIRDYSKTNAQAVLLLTEWYFTIRATNARNFNELKRKFSSIDLVNGYTIFDIGGNNYRLITAIHYNMQYCYIRTLWTHTEYSKPFNQAKLKRGEL